MDFEKFPQHWFLRDIVVHTAVVFTHKEHEVFLQPFVELIFNPATLKVCRLLTAMLNLKS